MEVQALSERHLKDLNENYVESVNTPNLSSDVVPRMLSL